MSAEPSLKAVGEEMLRLIRELYPICRSLSGEGVRETLRAIQKRIPLTIHEVPSGEPALDWTVPREWNIRDAFVKDRPVERSSTSRRRTCT